VNVPARHAPGFIAAVTQRVPVALAVFALRRPFRSAVRFHFRKHTTDVGKKGHFRNVRALRHRHNEVRCKVTVLLGVLVPSPRSELHDGLRTYEQCHQLLSDLSFGHALSQVFHQHKYASSTEGDKVKKHTLALTEGPQSISLTVARKPSEVSGTSIRHSV
jgi:hypothetical protein